MCFSPFDKHVGNYFSGNTVGNYCGTTDYMKYVKEISKVKLNLRGNEKNINTTSISNAMKPKVPIIKKRIPLISDLLLGMRSVFPLFLLLFLFYFFGRTGWCFGERLSEHNTISLCWNCETAWELRWHQTISNTQQQLCMCATLLGLTQLLRIHSEVNVDIQTELWLWQEARALLYRLQSLNMLEWKLAL